MTQAISKWQVRIDRQVFILTGQEVEAILAGHNQRFVKLKDIIINPAFIQSMVEFEDGKEKLLSLPEAPMTEEQKEKNKKRLKKIREKFFK